MIQRLTQSLLAVAVCFLPACATSTFQNVPEETSRIEVMFGERDFDNDFAPLDEPNVIGVTYASTLDGELAGWEVGFLRTDEDDDVAGIDVDLETNELFAGGRYEFNVGHGPIHPYIGAGLSYIDAELKAAAGGASGSDDDQSLGIYAHIGAYANVGGSLTIGIDFRALLESELEFEGGDIDADYTQLVFTVGFGF